MSSVGALGALMKPAYCACLLLHSDVNTDVIDSTILIELEKGLLSHVASEISGERTPIRNNRVRAQHQQ